MKIAEVWDRIVCLLYPPRCVLCDRVVEYDDLWCGKCPLEHRSQALPPADGLPEALSPFPYEDSVRDAVLTLKKQPDKRTARFFALYMTELLATGREAPNFDLIVPVPASPGRLAERGFNQAEVLAGAVAGLLQVPVQPRALARRDSAEAQHNLSAADRLRNARDAYYRGTAAVDGRRILLVDDVFTTGATMAACSALLLEMGAVGVCGVTAAWTPQRV